MPEVHVACARCADFADGDVELLAATLDDGEREALQRLRIGADRRAFVVAHALLRGLTANEIAVPAAALTLRHDAKGRPYFAQAPQLHVSVSRSREAVAVAVTQISAIGIDIESVAGKPADADVLDAFVVTHEPVTTREFFFQWTALEAFWKACGTGLADDQPRICCVRQGAGRFDVHLENSKRVCAGRGAVVHAFDDCALAVVLRAPADPGFVLKRTDCGSPEAIEQLGRVRWAQEIFDAA